MVLSNCRHGTFSRQKAIPLRTLERSTALSFIHLYIVRAGESNFLSLAGNFDKLEQIRLLLSANIYPNLLFALSALLSIPFYRVYVSMKCTKILVVKS